MGSFWVATAISPFIASPGGTLASAAAAGHPGDQGQLSVVGAAPKCASTGAGRAAGADGGGGLAAAPAGSVGSAGAGSPLAAGAGNNPVTVLVRTGSRTDGRAFRRKYLNVCPAQRAHNVVLQTVHGRSARTADGAAEVFVSTAPARTNGALPGGARPSRSVFGRWPATDRTRLWLSSACRKNVPPFLVLRSFSQWFRTRKV